MTGHEQIWHYRNDVEHERGQIIGYEVHATDGNVGPVEDETIRTDASHLVVDTGFWVFGTKRLIPAGAVTSIDHDNKTIQLRMTKDQVLASPEYEPTRTEEEGLDSHVAYYAGISWERV